MKTFLDVLKSELTRLELKDRFNDLPFKKASKVERERVALKIDTMKAAIAAYKKAEKLK